MPSSHHVTASGSTREWRQAPAWDEYAPVQGPTPFEFGDHPRRTLAQELAGARDAHRGQADPHAAFWPAERPRKPSTTLKEKDVKRTWRAKRPFSAPSERLAHLPKTC